MATIAKGYERLAIELHSFLEYYTPRGWNGPIMNYAHTPHFQKEEVVLLMKAHRENKFEKLLKELVKSEKREILSHWYIQEGLRQFFIDKRYEPYESELV